MEFPHHGQVVESKNVFFMGEVDPFWAELQLPISLHLPGDSK